MILQLYIFLFGLVFGSFFNACIYRAPREKTLLTRSFCTSCSKKISWFDNIPLLSFLILRAKCRHCSAAISWRYPTVELATGLLWVYLFNVFGLSWLFAHAIVFLSLLFVSSVIDIETGLLPDVITLPGILLGLIFAAVRPELLGEVTRLDAFLQSFAALLLGGGIVWLTGWLGELAFKKESMGGGDIKFMAMMGTFIGVQKVLLAFFLAPFFALPIALYAKFVTKKETIPFGPYLALGGAALYLFGTEIIGYIYNPS